MKQAHLWKKLKDNIVQCKNCSHYCIISEGKRGICGVRKNIKGTLYALNYAKACAVGVDPIEKKPLFHFLPGTYSLSIATIGCNFSCQNCQNWKISQAPKFSEEIWGEEISPKEIIKRAKALNCPSVSYTYTEPTIFSEYALDIMKLAAKIGLKNCWVSNGYFSKELFDLIYPYLDAINVDLKSFDNEFYVKYCGGQLNPVLENLKRLKEKNIWVEITTLVIPTLNDSEENFYKIVQFIKNELGEETPWHITQFCGAISWKLKNIPDTPIETLIKAREIGLEEGLKYVYTGNVPGLEGEDTFCPKCGTKVIDRSGYIIQRYDKNGKCPKCNKKLDIIE